MNTKEAKNKKVDNFIVSNPFTCTEAALCLIGSL
jgi:hypothetical protein